MNARQPIGAAMLAVALAALAQGAAQGPASAQANLDAGKSPEKLFAQGCGTCHGTPQELAQVRRDFLIQHYTTGPQQADLLAAYLEAVRNEPGRTPKPRRSPRADIDVADVTSTGSIGGVTAAPAPPEVARPEDAAPEAAKSAVVSLPPLDIDE
jgi:hypothetical protein